MLAQQDTLVQKQFAAPLQSAKKIHATTIDTCEHLCYSGFVKLIAQVKLQTTPEQLAALRQTMQEANRACDYISSVAWDKKTFKQFALHKLVYHALRVRKPFGLSAQVVVPVYC